jgi:aspartate/methionine/tyrosine aminotransferase
VSARELEDVLAVCRSRGWTLIVDEVFADYPLDAEHPLTDIASRADVLTFTLGGASKMLGLPQVKLGWIVAGGPSDERREALHALEHIADTFLSVGTPVQIAAPSLLRDGAWSEQRSRARARQPGARRARLPRRIPHVKSCEWKVDGARQSACPATRPEDVLVLELLESERVLVHPGYFFDFPHEAFVVVSLLVEPAPFADAFERCLSS